jgi:3-oxoacyl-[acyl-carrier-protein] synthase-3
MEDTGMATILQGTGMYVPDNVVDNHRLSRVMDTTDAWIQQRTGIVTRHFANLDQGSSDMAVPAARAAMEDAGVDPSDIDYVVCATMTPDYYFPGSGAVIQDKLGLPHAPCLDIRQQCAGFLFGLQVSDALLQAGRARNVLLIGCEVHGGFMPFRSWDVILGRSDADVSEEEYAFNTRFRDRVVLFGDGAGAAVVRREEGDGTRGLIDIRIHTDGALFDKMWVNGGGSKYRPYFSAEMHESGDIVPIVVGREVFRTAVTYMPAAVNEILEANGKTLDDLKLLVMHQANLRINEAVQQRLGLPDDRVYNNIQKYGNTTAATIPMAFHEAKTERDLKPGDLVCFVALGSGLSWGAALYRV